jgi:transposase
MKLTEEQWVLLSDLIPEPPVRSDKRGRPWKEKRAVLEGVLWILRTGAPWADLPKKYPPYQTCHRRFQQWAQDGTLDKVIKQLARHLEETGKIKLKECFIDGTFVPAKKGALELGKPRGERELKSWQLQTLMVFLSPYAQKALNLTK